MEPEVVGAIKIKDGLFIGDEFAAQVQLTNTAGFRVRCRQQGYTHHKLFRTTSPQSLGANRRAILNVLLARPGHSGSYGHNMRVDHTRC